MYQLRPYQHEAVQATLQHFRKERTPAVIVLPTGAGKSLVIAELARIARGRVLVLAHVKELVEQNFEKFHSYGLSAGIFSAGLKRKDINQKVIFGSIQSVANAEDDFFLDYSLVIIDECHRVGLDSDTQYHEVIHKLKNANSELCILGLTATPYRLGIGWIYEYHQPKKEIKTKEERFFKKCLYELTLRYMIKNNYLTPPVKIDAPVACYDFSSLNLLGGKYSDKDIENLLKDQKRITPVIIKNIIDLSEDRQGVMIFTSSVRHAREILTLLPMGSAIVTGETETSERDEIITAFKNKQLKYLVNVSVLTTGFDAPHVDVIALLRPTESVSLFQQIVGRGLRLSPGKKDCLILDYTGLDHDLFSPIIEEDKPHPNSTLVKVLCPLCGHENEFWGIVEEGEVVEHFGRRCMGGFVNEINNEVEACQFRFRFKRCPDCGSEEDIAARVCTKCQCLLVDPDNKLKEAMALKDAHIMRPDSFSMNIVFDKKGNERLEIRYYDYDGEFLQENYYLNTDESCRAFYFNFLKFHNRTPEKNLFVNSPAEVLKIKDRLRLPKYIIARKKDRYWVIREKIFE